MTLPSSDAITHLQHTIRERYADHQRILPWRQTTDPYKILVSEIMLQQTQVDRVIPKYHARLEKWPTVKDLAWATQADILTAWSGLGYNRRALNLYKAAQKIVHDYHGQILPDEKVLLWLPGVGLYTAHAILAFAYNLEVPVLDINIKRVLIHNFDLDPKMSDKELRTIALACVPIGRSRDRHNALMDYGSLVLHSKKTGIRSAPQSTFQWSRRQVRGNVLKYLIKHGKADKKTLQELFPHEERDHILQAMLDEKIIQKNTSDIFALA